MIKYSRILLLLFLVSVVDACSFVSLDPQARDVVVSTDSSAIKNCKYLGDITVSLWSKASDFQSNSTVMNQLDTLARNQANNLGGNVVISKSAITNDQETYGVYKCPQHI